MKLSLEIDKIEDLAKGYFDSVIQSASFIAAGSAGVSMGKIGMYPFFMHTNDFKAIEESLTASFGSFKPIKGQDILSDSGGYGSSIKLNGVLVAQSLNALKPLKWYLKKREPIRFTTISFDKEVVITSLQTTKNFFTTTGAFRVQSYNIVLKEVYNDIL